MSSKLGWSQKADHAADYYEILGVARNASAKDIESAYRKKALKYHPDKNHEPDAVVIFKRLVDCKEMLLDDSARSKYDKTLARNESRLVREQEPNSSTNYPRHAQDHEKNKDCAAYSHRTQETPAVQPVPYREERKLRSRTYSCDGADQNLWKSRYRGHPETVTTHWREFPSPRPSIKASELPKNTRLFKPQDISPLTCSRDFNESGPRNAPFFYFRQPAPSKSTREYWREIRRANDAKNLFEDSIELFNRLCSAAAAIETILLKLENSTRSSLEESTKNGSCIRKCQRMIGTHIDLMNLAGREYRSCSEILSKIIETDHSSAADRFRRLLRRLEALVRPLRHTKRCLEGLMAKNRRTGCVDDVDLEDWLMLSLSEWVSRFILPAWLHHEIHAYSR